MTGLQVRKDQVTGRWRVTCAVHGAVSHPGNFWTASRDAKEHAQLCELQDSETERAPAADSGGGS